RRVPTRFVSANTLLATGLAVAIGFAVASTMLSGPGKPSVYWAVLWAIPYALVAMALPDFSPRYRSLRAWLCAGLIAVTCAMPMLWSWHVDAKLRGAERREISRLGTEANSFLDFQLRVFAQKAQRFAEEGESGVNLLYHGWVESQLAQEGYE